MFQSKTVIITGSGAGIGRAAALQFASCGANVVVNSRSDSGQSVCDEILSAGHSAVFIPADVAAADGARRLVEAAAARFGGIDVLVNNAGIVPSGSVETITEEEWNRAMDVNVKSVYLMSKYALPYLRRSKGVIVNTVSTVAIKGVVNRALYSATKGAVLSLSRSMAAEYVQDGIRINCVCPGTVMTPSFQKRVSRAEDPEQALRDFIARQPMGRLGTADEIASAMLFAASDRVSFMTGTNLVVDGGMTM